jgi:hypothetical protein
MSHGHGPNRSNGWRPAIEGYVPEYGANDGIVTALVVIAAYPARPCPRSVILVLGFANLLADGFAMGTSKVLSVRTTQTLRGAIVAEIDKDFTRMPVEEIARRLQASVR